MKDLIVLATSAKQAEALAEMAMALAGAYGLAVPDLHEDELLKRVKSFMNGLYPLGSTAAELTASKIGSAKLNYPIAIMWLKVHEECRRVLLSNELIASIHNEMQ